MSLKCITASCPAVGVVGGCLNSVMRWPASPLNPLGSLIIVILVLRHGQSHQLLQVTSSGTWMWCKHRCGFSLEHQLKGWNSSPQVWTLLTQRTRCMGKQDGTLPPNSLLCSSLSEKRSAPGASWGFFELLNTFKSVSASEFTVISFITVDFHRRWRGTGCWVGNDCHDYH